MRSELARLFRTLEIPAIVVTHDWVDASTLGDRMVLMNSGRVLQTGSPPRGFHTAAASEVATAVGVETLVAGRIRAA